MLSRINRIISPSHLPGLGKGDDLRQRQRSRSGQVGRLAVDLGIGLLLTLIPHRLRQDRLPSRFFDS